MGQCENASRQVFPLAKIIQAHMTASCSSLLCPGWANASVSLSNHPANKNHVGPRCSLVQRPIVRLMG